MNGRERRWREVTPSAWWESENAFWMVFWFCVALMVSSCSIGEGIGKRGDASKACIEQVVAVQKQIIELQKGKP